MDDNGDTYDYDYDYDGDADDMSENEGQNSACDSQNYSYIRVLKYCPYPCGSKSLDPNGPMCIRTCLCPPNFMLNRNRTRCLPMTDKVKQMITRNARRSLENESGSQRGEGMAIQNT